MAKNLSLQHYEYINNVLKIIGFSGLDDYSYIFKFSDLSTNQIDQINNTLNKFKELFLQRDFNLSRSDGKLLSVEQTVGFIKKILTILNIPFNIKRIGGETTLRLKFENNLRNEFIKMSSFCHDQAKSLMSSTRRKVTTKELYEKYKTGDPITKTVYFRHNIDLKEFGVLPYPASFFLISVESECPDATLSLEINSSFEGKGKGTGKLALTEIFLPVDKIHDGVTVKSNTSEKVVAIKLTYVMSLPYFTGEMDIQIPFENDESGSLTLRDSVIICPPQYINSSEYDIVTVTAENGVVYKIIDFHDHRSPGNFSIKDDYDGVYCYTKCSDKPLYAEFINGKFLTYYYPVNNTLIDMITLSDPHDKITIGTREVKSEIAFPPHVLIEGTRHNYFKNMICITADNYYEGKISFRGTVVYQKIH